MTQSASGDSLALSGHALLQATERNLAAHAAHLHAFVKGASVFRVGDFQVSDSGLGHDTFNMVSRVDFERGFRPEDVRDVAAYVEGTGRPFSWWVADEAALSEAAPALEAAGFTEGETEDVMYADLRTPRPPTPVPRGVQIEAVAGGDRLGEYATVLAANWEPPATEVETFLLSAGSRVRWPHQAGSRFFTAFVDGRVVAGAEVHMAAGVAGLFGIATLEAYRGRGIASALVAACLEWAASEGSRLAVLQATAAGSGVYRRHGFRSVGRCTEFHSSGLDASTVTSPASESRI